MRARLIVLAVTALTGALLVAPQSAGAVRGLEVALQDDRLFLHRGGVHGQYYSRDTAFDQMRAMQGSALRVNLAWSHAVVNDQERLLTKPANVEYDWAPYWSIINLARGYGVRVQFTLTGPAPSWATPTRIVERGHNRPNPRYFKEFVSAAAREFEGRVSRYSIWNEPNWISHLAPQRQAAWRYRQLYQVGYRAIKREDPKADVLFGELVPYDSRHAIAPLEFVRRVLCVNRRYEPTRRAVRQRDAAPLSGKRCAGGTLRADGFAHHPYEFLKPPKKARRPSPDDVSMGALDRLTDALDAAKESRALVPPRGEPWLPLYLTEFGYFREGDRKIPERKRAKWSVQGFRMAVEHPRVRQLLYYVFVQPPGGFSFDLSILDWQGGETRTYNALVRWATNAVSSGDVRAPRPKRDGVADRDPPPPPDGGPRPPPKDPPDENPVCEILPVPCPDERLFDTGI
ncbi:MAG TPA: hypothetical protein VD790_03000 [Thermoleophilaceae bacterium]|nr:hypothetical protein [Thermoleophilaceae bacterium]